MRYGEGDEESKNIEDRRGQEGGMSSGGLPFPFPMGGGQGGFSIMTLVIMALVTLFFGGNITDILTGGGGGGAGVPSLPQNRPFEPGQGRQTTQRAPFEIPGLPGGGGKPGAHAPDEATRFVGRVLKDTEEVWTKVFQSIGRQYQPPTLVIFNGRTPTACGTGQTAMGPFYCPLDKKVYIDLAFYEELKRRFHAPGDFAQAYVVAHEVGHHVQTLLGIADKLQEMKSRVSERQANAIQVRMELQADCLAGVWANLTNQIHGRLEQGDIESGLNAAAQIGDDMIQRQVQGRVVPESFTHGSSAQRVAWFKHGIDTGQLQQCDTLNNLQDPR